MAEVQRVRGTVVWWDDHRGIGFLHPQEWAEGSDLFVHYSQVHTQEEFKTLKAGQSVEFSIGKRDGETKPQAEAVVVLTEEDGAVA